MKLFTQVAAVRTDAIFGISTVFAAAFNGVYRFLGMVAKTVADSLRICGIRYNESDFAQGIRYRIRMYEYRMAQVAADNAAVSGNPNYIEHSTRVALLGAELRKL